MAYGAREAGREGAHYATTDDVWKDIEKYSREGFKIVLYSE
jgi:hypothetical protein